MPPGIFLYALEQLAESFIVLESMFCSKLINQTLASYFIGARDSSPDLSVMIFGTKVNSRTTKSDLED